jgi:hypothetical protein
VLDLVAVGILHEIRGVEIGLEKRHVAAREIVGKIGARPRNDLRVVAAGVLVRLHVDVELRLIGLPGIRKRVFWDEYPRHPLGALVDAVRTPVRPAEGIERLARRQRVGYKQLRRVDMRARKPDLGEDLEAVAVEIPESAVDLRAVAVLDGGGWIVGNQR